MEGIAPKNIANILRHFLPHGNDFEVLPITQGLINDSYKISFPDRAYFLQRLNTQIFQNSEDLMFNIGQWQQSIQGSSLPAPTYLKTTQGPYFAKDEQGHLWRMQTYIPNAMAYDIAPNEKIAKEAGRLLGHFHGISKHLNTQSFKTPIPQFQDIHLRWQQFQQACDQADANTLQAAQKTIEILQTLQDFAFNTPKGLPMRLCHNDTKLNNMLFHEKRHKGICLVDLDTLMPGFAFYDFGDALRTVANTAAEGDLNTPVLFKTAHAASFISGLCERPEAFTKKEWLSLPFGAVYMPFLHGLRALTDFLAGNLYYKVSYPNENLDRAQSMLSFAQKAHEKQDFLIQSIAASV